MKKRVSGYLAILATPSTKYKPFPEKSFYAFMTQAGRRIGLPVYVILPTHINFTSRTVVAYRYTPEKKWVRVRMPFPSLIYDRLSNRTKYTKQIRALKEEPSITFLGHVLGDKLKNHNHLIQHAGIAAHMPPTELVTSMQVVRTMLDEYESIIVKPMRNSLGIGVMKLTSNERQHRAEGRDFKNKIFHREFVSRQALLLWLRNECTVKMIAQPYLSLHTPEGIPFDIRVLVQKNGRGEWTETGRAVRAGVADGLTSNLCGGGKAHECDDFLYKHFSEGQLDVINHDINEIVSELPTFLEQRHGRLVELGIDIGIDRQGKVWLIEVNSKPGRASFRRIEGGKYYREVRLNPLRYAYYLAKSRGDGRQGSVTI
ncbi:YheC/YheD family protein [Aneurinibacillus sp. BA2021]|nr:YheC/YheD family protein [Aneurinibacillus sp. BA2021]